MNKKILTVVGARPQIIKAAALSRVISASYTDKVTELIVHTGQHYDNEMSRVFFDEMHIPLPAYNLEIGSDSHADQTARMMSGLNEVFEREKPDGVLVYGDTNSTLAAALTASKLGIPVIHVEAGLRSFNKSMPEEINRVATDHVSTLLFTPTEAAITNLRTEGFKTDNSAPFHIDNPGVFHCGDVMYDNALHFKSIAFEKSDLLDRMGLKLQKYILATIHRDLNTDNTERLTNLLLELYAISEKYNTHVVIPMHPRTSKVLATKDFVKVNALLESSDRMHLIAPVSYLDMIMLESEAEVIITDSGGVQKEAFFFQRPCIILRPQTEWVELVLNGNAIIADADAERISKAYQHYTLMPSLNWPQFYGDGHAAEFICEKIISAL